MLLRSSLTACTSSSALENLFRDQNHVRAIILGSHFADYQMYLTVRHVEVNGLGHLTKGLHPKMFRRLRLQSQYFLLVLSWE